MLLLYYNNLFAYPRISTGAITNTLEATSTLKVEGEVISTLKASNELESALTADKNINSDIDEQHIQESRVLRTNT